MLILVCHPSSDLYGSDRMMAESIDALRAAGDSVSVLLPSNGPLASRLERDFRVMVRPMPVLRKSDLSPTALLALPMRITRGVVDAVRVIRSVRPDVIYVNTLALPQWIVAARMLGVPVICHVREAEDSVRVVAQRGLLAPLLACRAVVANSRSTQKWITDVYPRLTARSRVIYNGKDWSPFIGPVHRDLSPEPTLVVVGRLSARKGQDLAVEAVRLLVSRGRDVRLLLAGDVFAGNEAYERELRRKIRTAGLDDRVEVLGFVADVPGVLAQADLALVPSRQEPFGTVAAEALAAGLPVIAADVQGLAEIITDQVDGLLFRSGDASALMERIRQMLDDWPAAKQMAARGQAKVLREFGQERYAAELVALIHEAGAAS